MDAASQTPRRATRRDLEAVPPHLVAEILGGELFTSPRPRVRHSRVASVLGGVLGHHLDFGSGSHAARWWFLDEPELHLGDDIVVPDLAGWRRTTLPALPDTAALTVAPDWLCEVLSPSTARIDRTEKLPIYAREGVGHVWLVDPEARTLEVLRLHETRWLIAAVHGADEIVRAEPFDAIELALQPLWGEPPPPPHNEEDDAP